MRNLQYLSKQEMKSGEKIMDTQFVILVVDADASKYPWNFVSERYVHATLVRDSDFNSTH